MKTFILGILTALILGAAGERTYEAYRWKQNADVRGFVSERSATYLFGPSGVVVSASGEELSRQQLFDVLLHNAVEHTPGLAFKK